MFRTPLQATALALLTALPATADTRLGIIGTELRLGFSDQESEGGFVSRTVDVAITPYHGAQFDLQYEERSTGGIGRVGTVLYMTPRAGQKYGLSLMVADKNDASATYGQVGAAGMVALARDWTLEGRLSAGLSADNDLDWLGTGAGLHLQAGRATRLYAHYDIAHFDEQDFGAMAHEISLALRPGWATVLHRFSRRCRAIGSTDAMPLALTRRSVRGFQSPWATPATTCPPSG
ncbi:hypothetical protein AB2B41_05220 [Marimonas sp. MJW-29]|uniref:Porin n=1 Tax=Sulfitobacter sediminis TaxID=3234186 RepID=A0ABV3RJ48_9RHOB